MEDEPRYSDIVHQPWRRLYKGGVRVRRSIRRRLRPEPGEEYDTQTVAIMRRVLARDANSIDVGAAWGELLRPMVKLAPFGHHRAIEPQPDLAAGLRESFPTVEVHQLALSDHNGEAEFRFVVDAPGYSGLYRVPYPIDDVRVVTFTVELRRLDDLIDFDEPIAFIKIDVEGAELDVLRGAHECLTRHHPVVVFEYSGGLVQERAIPPAEFYDYLSRLGFAISTLDRWLSGEGPLERAEFPPRRADRGWHWMYVAYDPTIRRTHL